MLHDFNEGNRTPEDRKRREGLHKEIARRYPEALPDPATEEPVHRAGSIVTPYPVAFSVKTPPVVNEAMNAIGEKLAHALYYREMKGIVTAKHRVFVVRDQIQRAGAENLTDFLRRLLPDLSVGSRSNIKEYGNRFAYKSGCKPNEDLFAFAAQFGYGLICWGMVLGPNLEVDDSNEALRNMNWRGGGNGLGSQDVAEKSVDPLIRPRQGTRERSRSACWAMYQGNP